MTSNAKSLHENQILTYQMQGCDKNGHYKSWYIPGLSTHTYIYQQMYITFNNSGTILFIMTVEIYDFICWITLLYISLTGAKLGSYR